MKSHFCQQYIKWITLFQNRIKTPCVVTYILSVYTGYIYGYCSYLLAYLSISLLSFYLFQRIFMITPINSSVRKLPLKLFLFQKGYQNSNPQLLTFHPKPNRENEMCLEEARGEKYKNKYIHLLIYYPCIYAY